MSKLENYELFKRFSIVKDKKLKKQIQDELVELYVPLLRSLAAKVIKAKKLHNTPDELISYCYESLVKKINDYDLSKGVSFSVYARQRLYGAILDELRKENVIKRYDVNRIRQFKVVEKRLYDETGVKPSIDDVLNELEISKSLTKDDYLPINIQAIGDTSIASHNDFVADIDAQDNVDYMLSQLDDFERLIVERVIFDGIALDQFSIESDITLDDAKFYYDNAIAKLKDCKLT